MQRFLNLFMHAITFMSYQEAVENRFVPYLKEGEREREKLQHL